MYREAGVRSGVKWGWLFTEDDQKQPYICEISRANIYRILQEERGFGGSQSACPV